MSCRGSLGSICLAQRSRQKRTSRCWLWIAELWVSSTRWMRTTLQKHKSRHWLQNTNSTVNLHRKFFHFSGLIQKRSRLCSCLDYSLIWWFEFVCPCWSNFYSQNHNLYIEGLNTGIGESRGVESPHKVIRIGTSANTITGNGCVVARRQWQRASGITELFLRVAIDQLPSYDHIE